MNQDLPPQEKDRSVPFAWLRQWSPSGCGGEDAESTASWSASPALGWGGFRFRQLYADKRTLSFGRDIHRHSPGLPHAFWCSLMSSCIRAKICGGSRLLPSNTSFSPSIRFHAVNMR
uniref:Uncharacterized protein n=1 Tax=Setaria viridis TaxID=4556 RepID=A0A4V6Y8L3_SETVI|nr:hypothetical protein SEVIR_3G031301v2 [Setaria viridis]